MEVVVEVDRQPTGSSRERSRSPQVKRARGKEGSADDQGWRTQGRKKHQNRPAAAGASTVAVEDVGDLHPSLQYYIGNTPGKATDEVIKKVLERCAVPLLQDEDPLVIESVHSLTKDPDARTRCWRIVVPHKFKDIMENNLLYPEGWKYREFVGIFRNTSKAAKKIRISENTIVDHVMAESEEPVQGNDQLLHTLHEHVEQLLQMQGNNGQQGGGQDDIVPVQSVQTA